MKMRIEYSWNDTDRDMVTTYLTWTDLGSNMVHREQRPRELYVKNIPESSALREIESIRQESAAKCLTDEFQKGTVSE